MILVKAPLRISLFGGGTDIPSHYKVHGGATLSFTFDKYVYAAIMKTPHPHIKVTYSTTECVPTANEVSHNIIREALKLHNITTGIEVSSFADIPTKGTGLGASSAFTVALLMGLRRYTHAPYQSTHDRAMGAAAFEQTNVGSPIGDQDHVAAAYGGCVYMRYFSGVPVVTQCAVPHPTMMELHDRLLLVKTIDREYSANDILNNEADPDQLNCLARHAIEGHQLLMDGNVTAVGRLLDTTWTTKLKTRKHISARDIDEMYDLAKTNGAIGGKLLGAGGGGYLLLCATSRASRDNLRYNIFGANETHVITPIHTGAEIVYAD